MALLGGVRASKSEFLLRSESKFRAFITFSEKGFELSRWGRRMGFGESSIFWYKMKIREKKKIRWETGIERD